MKHVPIYILLVLIIALLFRGCESGQSTNEVIITNDTIVNTYTITDTIVRYDTAMYVRDTILNNDTLQVNVYTYAIEDSLVKGTITMEGVFNPNLSYDLAFKSFHTTQHTKVIEKNLRGFLYGGQLTVEPLVSQLEINLAYQFKQGNIIKAGLGYDFNQQNPIITIGFLKRF